MSSPAGQLFESFCAQHGISMPIDAEHIRAGRNSEVLRVSNGDGQWILKHYHQHAGDSRDRLGTEYKFLQFLEHVGIDCVPRPMGMDRAQCCALYSFLPGRRPRQIEAWHIEGAGDFIVQMNRHPQTEEASVLGPAADACFTWLNHLALVDRRLGTLSALTPASDVERQAQDFIHGVLLPCWCRIASALIREPGDPESERLLEQDARILSPSDFGFHNALESAEGLSFVDFEYAGWDDPVKLICDFYCQPELPVTVTQGQRFCEIVLQILPRPEAVRTRVQLLLPVHRVKWCCILLNEFRSADRQRRLHAGIEQDGLLTGQLNKAQSYFNQHLANYL